MKNSLIRQSIFLALVITLFIGAQPCLGAEYPPGISFSSLLNGFYILANNGEIRLTHVQATFLPGTDAKVWAVIKKEGGQDLYRLDFMVEKLASPYYLLDFYSAVDLAGGGKTINTVECRLGQPGKYRMDFFLDGQKFFTFPFEISKVSPSDPFSGEESFFIDGEWERWAYLYYSEANINRMVQWKVWLRNKAATREKDVKPSLDVVGPDGKIVAVGPVGVTYTLGQRWNRFAIDLHHPSKSVSGGALMKASELLAKDGQYSLTLKLNGIPYGTWKFRVEGGRPAYEGRTLRGKADPITFIEGGKDAWWYEKK
jgi:hypothetical protein